MSFAEQLKKFKAPNTLMVQGCTSDAGKSIIAAGLCRLLAQQHVSVAPFKPQNMALNSAVTREGGEIGRAQALQAYAAGLESRNDFNPVLLKPESDCGAQVIVQGKVVSQMQAKAFHDYKQQAMSSVLDSYQRLNQEFKVVIVEGAGSPAEINLRDRDIANMGFAEAVDCPVILVADIDRGGVFAHLVGTLELLSKSEQDRVIGFVINRFRGDIALLQNGLDWLEAKTNKPVLGVIPYLKDFYVDAEDAVTVRQSVQSDKQTIKVVAPVLPRISNHTDFDALQLNQNIDFSFVPIETTDFEADLIILPGTKSVISDLKTLKQHGWDKKLQQHIRYGGKLIGVCGGYQMLGESIDDPKGIENSGNAEQADGFGLLPIKTTLLEGKHLKNTNGRYQHSEFLKNSVTGYEIHCGISQGIINSNALFKLESGELEGCVSDDSKIIGSYLHGLFDQGESCDAILDWMGMADAKSQSFNEIRDQQLDRLAECLDTHLHSEFLASLIQR